jgi:hypothetical protein
MRGETGGRQAEQALAAVSEWTATAGLRLHRDKTRIVDATQRGGFDFLGYQGAFPFRNVYRNPTFTTARPR